MHIETFYRNTDYNKLHLEIENNYYSKKKSIYKYFYKKK